MDEKWVIKYIDDMLEMEVIAHEAKCLARLRRGLPEEGARLAEELESALARRCNALDEDQKRAREALESVGDAEERAVLAGRYLEGLELEKLAEREGRSVEWVRRKLGVSPPPRECAGR